MSETNPLLANLKLPGRIFQLPSRGIFYRNGELSDNVKDGEIHVHPMSAMDEINMKNADQLFSGTAVNEVFKHCVSGVEKPSDLLAKDVDAIMLFLRAVTYGSSYEFMAKHTCKDAKDHSYVADVEQMISSVKMLDPTVVESNYTVTLQNGQVVRLRPNRYQQVLDLIKRNENKRSLSAEEQKENLLLMLLGVIESVDGVSNVEHITEWIKAVPSPMINRIGDKVERVNDWGPNNRWTCKCKDCGESFEVEIPINPVAFFIE
jgi:hypothetical protein